MSDDDESLHKNMQLFLSVRCLFIFAVDVICCRLITVVVYEGRVTTVTWPTPAIVICRCRAKIWLDDSAWKWFFCGLTLFFWLCCALANEIMRRTMLSRISIYFHSIYFLDNDFVHFFVTLHRFRFCDCDGRFVECRKHKMIAKWKQWVLIW